MLNRCTSGLLLVVALAGSCGAARPDERGAARPDEGGDTSFRAEVRKYLAAHSPVTAKRDGRISLAAD